jgi:acyl-CoA thioester hydrolase
MPEKKSIYRRKVNFYETDAQGVVHHSNYFRYFEEARGYLLEELGYPYHKMHNEGLYVVLVEGNIRIKRPIVYQDTFDIEISLSIENEYSLSFGYKIYINNTIHSTGYTKHCITKNTKLIKIPEFLVNLIND